MENKLFHVHTFRCGHAEMVPDDQPTIIGFDAHFLKDIDTGMQQLLVDELEE